MYGIYGIWPKISAAFGLIFLAFLSTAFLLNCSDGSNKDRIIEHCIKSHEEIVVDPVGTRDIERRQEVCDESIPIAHYHGKNYKLGEEYLEPIELK